MSIGSQLESRPRPSLSGGLGAGEAPPARLNPAAMLFDFRIAGDAGWGFSMRALMAGFVLLAVTQPSFAQTVLKTEPLALAPHAVVLVDNGSCSTGKVLKVTVTARGLHRKKVCVSAVELQASLGSSAPERAPSSEDRD